MHHASINLRDEDNDTPLKKAYILGNSTVLTAILQKFGYDSIKIDSSLLYQVCERGSVEFLNVLLFDFHLNPASIVDDYGNTALHIAIFHAHKEVATCLVDAGCPVNRRNSEGQTPLHLLCGQRLNDSVEFLLRWFVTELKADINSRDYCGDQPIHKAALSGCTDIITTLIFDFHCDPESRGYNNRSLLHQAFSAGHIATTKALIEVFHLSIHSTDSNGKTPLHLSSFHGQPESVRTLLYDYHAPVFVRNISGKTALDLTRKPSIKQIFQEYIKSENKNIQLAYVEMKTLSQRKYSGEQTITRVFVLGHPESGKSTLVESLKQKGISSF